MKKRVHVTLTVKIDVDAEYSAEDHVEDILKTARKTSPFSHVDVLNFKISDTAGEPDRSAFVRLLDLVLLRSLGRPFVARTFKSKIKIPYWKCNMEKRKMIAAQRERPEDRHARADRVAREHILSERRERERKTARLRALRLEMEKAAN
ncbi:hypothetical protein [Mesorhizobium sp. Root157]|uniref:hypothetical protein n=1 Tax=Mesorhizobium sp. Root157 TaxID=1736477 RepID=UPI0012E3432B|nr:hypothetical protein [Mesorhizobium sp. Root157]